MVENILHSEAIKKLRRDLRRAITDWDYLSGISGEGPIAEFEAEFAKIMESEYAIALTNATSALYVALMASGIGKGDEVILPSYTWPQTLTPVILTGATPVFADIQRDTVTVSPESVKKLINRKTRAIIAVHLYGIPSDVFTLHKIAKDHGCILIYDSAQGLGSYLNDKPLGTYGDFVAYSFGRSKLFSVGEGGALICRNRDLYEKAVAFSQHPLRIHKDIDNTEMREKVDGISMNFRLHPLVASLALGQLKGFIKSGIFKQLKERFKEIYETIKSTDIRHILPKIPEGASPNGMCLPLIIKRKDDLLKIKSLSEKYGFDIYLGGLQRPLHLTETIKRHRFIFHSDLRKSFIPSHKTHNHGSCPNTESRCKFQKQAFIKITDDVLRFKESA
uniref:Aminotransferase class I/II-fold pyridoxal phosphate-dependent enzyme n=1 Tax=Dictyoglomus turgidum TaxID=513050 RepID=A0A7C3WUU8_9BACT